MRALACLLCLAGDRLCPLFISLGVPTASSYHRLEDRPVIKDDSGLAGAGVRERFAVPFVRPVRDVQKDWNVIPEVRNGVLRNLGLSPSIRFPSSVPMIDCDGVIR